MARMASPYDDMHVGSFFSLAHKGQIGEKKTPAVTVSQLRILLKIVLPMKKFSPNGIIELIKGIQLRNHRAYISHRKRKLLKASNHQLSL